MNWTRILRAAGIPDSPGRLEAIEAMNTDRIWEICLRCKKTGLLTTIDEPARTLYEAVNNMKVSHPKHTIVRCMEKRNE
jgi:hypothetical protein